MAKIIVIDVINVGASIHVPTPKGGYNTIEVAYKESGKVGGKKLVDFADPAVFNAVSQLVMGDRAEVTLEKEAARDGREFWQWKAVRVLEAGEVVGNVSGSGIQEPAKAASSPTTGVSAPAARPAGKVTGSTYATAEERAQIQVAITRQSSLERAIEFLSFNADKFTVSQAINLAEQFKEFVFNGIQDNSKESSKETGASLQKGYANPNAGAAGSPVLENIPVQVAAKRGRPKAPPAPLPTEGYMDEYESDDVPSFLNSAN